MCTPLTLSSSGPGLDRSNSRLRTDFLRLVGRHSKPNKPACPTSPAPGMTASLVSTRAFLSTKTAKMKNFHRKGRSPGDSATPIQPVVHAAPQPVAIERERSPVKLLDATAPNNTEPDTTSAESSKAPSHNGDLDDADDAASIDDTPMRVSEPFEGLPDYRPGSSSKRELIDHDYLQSAFGITMDESPSTKDHEKSSNAVPGDPMTPPESEDETYEMDIPIQLAKERRPDLQVSIPEKGSQITSSTTSKVTGRTVESQESLNSVSPPSRSTPMRVNKPFNGLATARLSIVSPLSVVEMPKPRRPFSALSLEGITGVGTPPAAKSATSNSSEDTNEQDGKSSTFCHSPRSSMSSVNSELASMKKSKDPTPNKHDAAVSEDSQSSPKRPKNTRTNTAPVRPPTRPLRDQRSYASLRSTTSTANRNKPLPPEPLGQVPVRPLNIVGRTSSRSSTITSYHRATGPQVHGGESSIAALNVSRRPSRSSASLRSKYTPKDLAKDFDALDHAFTSTMPPHNQIALSYTTNSTPTLSQVTLALENQLGTIKEDSPDHTLLITAGDPLQISRGPMRMEPSRRAPPPPVRSSSPAQDRPEPRRRFMKRSASSNHVISQLRSSDGFGVRRSSTAVVGSSSKANRVLGKSGAATPPRMERKTSMESTWSANESPQMYTATASPAMSAEETHTPDSEQQSAPDAHFEEIRKRLELLSPKEDPTATFLAFHQRNASMNEKVVVLKRQMSCLETVKEIVQPPDSAEIKIPEHIAELEAPRTPSPVELEDTQRPLPVELRGSSPQPPIIQPPVEDEARPREKRGRQDGAAPKSAAPSEKPRSLHSQRSVKCRSLASLAYSEIPDLYAAIPSAEPRMRPSLTPEEVEQLISADAAERVLLRILESLENLKDLFAAAEVSRGFYRTFKRHELHLIKNALWSMSPAAWELREMSVPFAELESGTVDYKPAVYLRHYSRDLLTMVELKGMILDHCKSFLRPETISGLAGETDRSPYIDDAFWRVWTFCKIFGCGKGREDDIVGQMDWLRGGKLARQQQTDTNTIAMSDGVSMNSVLINPPAGFGQGNGNGLTAAELYDMTEIWTCLGVLVRGFHGKRDEAREYGVFDSANIASGDVEKENATIEEWTYRLLTLAPAAILEVAAPTTPTRATFATARSHGYTAWTPPSQGASRSTFLKEAVSRVYGDKMVLCRPSLSTASSFSTLPQVVASPASAAPSSPDPALAARQRCAVHAAEIRAKRQDPTYKDVPVSEERPMSNYPDVLARLEALSTSATTAPPVPKLPSLAARLSFRKPKVIISQAPKSKLKVSPLASANASPSDSPSRHRLDHSPRSPHSQDSLATPSDLAHEKLPVSIPNTPPPPAQVPTGPQVRDPVDVAVERLTAMGFDEKKAKKALAETDSGNSVNFERAVSMLVKERERRKMLGRLERMG